MFFRTALNICVKSFFNIFTGSSGCVYHLLTEIFELETCPSDLLVAERYQDWLKELLFIIKPSRSWAASSRVVWLGSEKPQKPGHLYLLLRQMRKSLTLTLLISASCVCPHFYIVGVPPSAFWTARQRTEANHSVLQLKAVLFLTLPLTAILVGM